MHLNPISVLYSAITLLAAILEGRGIAYMTWAPSVIKALDRVGLTSVAALAYQTPIQPKLSVPFKDQAHEIMDDEDYCYEDVYLLVQNVRFKAPRRIFDESEVFQDMFSMPCPNNQPPDGSAPNLPLVLHGVEALDFRRLLQVLLPWRPGPCKVSLWEEWVSVLELSTMWHFQATRDEAITTLANMSSDPVDELVLAHKYEIRDWIIPSLNRLAQRSVPLRATEAHRLEPLVGLDYILKIGEVRESFVLNTIRPCNYAHRRSESPEPFPPENTFAANRQTYDFTSQIHKVFGM